MNGRNANGELHLSEGFPPPTIDRIRPGHLMHDLMGRQTRSQAPHQPTPPNDSLDAAHPIPKGCSMIEQDTLFIGGEWVDPAGSDTHRGHLAAHRGGRRPRCPRAPTADIDRAVAAARDRVRRRRLAAAAAGGAHRRRRSASPTSTPRRMMDMAEVITDGDGLADLVLAPGAGAGAVDDAQHLHRASPPSYPWEETRTGMLGTDVIVRREPRRRRRRASCRGTCPQFVTMSKLAPGAAGRLHDRHQARARDAARRATSWPSCSRRPASRRASCQHRARRPRGRRAPRAPPAASTRSRSPARPRPAARIAAICGEQLKRVQPRARRQVGRDHPRRRRPRAPRSRA